MFDRIIKLIGEDKFKLIQDKHILLIGVGGVGSAALETLVRSGFQNIQIIDYDKVDISNLNRQLITDMSNIGELKVNAAYKRMKLINPDINLSCQAVKLTEDNLITILDSGFDYVIDACDDINIKYELIRLSCKMDFKLIESMGTAKKTLRGTLDFKTGSSGSVGDEQEDALLLSEDVINSTMPVILCQEEDVEGRHGATIGQLGEDLLFYMQTRGIDEEEAKRIMIKARLESVARLIPDEEIKQLVIYYVQQIV